MSTTPEFGTQLIGRTEKALNAILDRQLAGTGITEPQWVTLTVAVMNAGTITHAQLVSRVAGALKLSETQAQTQISELVSAQLLQRPHDDGSSVRVTDAGSALHRENRTAVAEITHRLWGDLPADDIATAGRVLRTVLERADAELARD
jgi:DNA-binding MarR family transcriptional regulator